MRKLGLDPATIKYAIITHAHGDHVGGAKLLQDRFRSRIVMGGPDWDLIERSVNGYPEGKPTRDIVAADGQKIVLGDGSVTIVTTPGHTPGTLSMLFTVKDNGKPLSVAYSGGTAFNFPSTVPNFDIYRPQRKMAAAAARGRDGAVSNHGSQRGVEDQGAPRAGRRAASFDLGARRGALFRQDDGAGGAIADAALQRDSRRTGRYCGALRVMPTCKVLPFAITSGGASEAGSVQGKQTAAPS